MPFPKAMTIRGAAKYGVLFLVLFIAELLGRHYLEGDYLLLALLPVFQLYFYPAFLIGYASIGRSYNNFLVVFSAYGLIAYQFLVLLLAVSFDLSVVEILSLSIFDIFALIFGFFSLLFGIGVSQLRVGHDTKRALASTLTVLVAVLFLTLHYAWVGSYLLVIVYISQIVYLFSVKNRSLKVSINI